MGSCRVSRASSSDLDIILAHRAVWASRPELRAAYGDYFTRLLAAAGGLTPLVELGSGPGFFKEFHPALIATDIVRTPHIDVATDAGALPFADASIGAIVMLDVLHHLPRPLEFLREAARVLKSGGRLVMIEPWITPASFVLYRVFHHEDCRFGVDLDRPFGASGKAAFVGNATIPYELLKQPERIPRELELTRSEPYIGLPYLATFGFKAPRALPRALAALGRAGEKLLQPFGGIFATRTLIVFERRRRPES
jgi:SAM-dependent methyltransferase